MKSTLRSKLLVNFCSILLLLAPALAITQRCALFWGETDIPDSLKS